jgi:glycosyltransferase involved in cell wall biosynthesis
MSDSGLISVVIPNYNGAATIGRCLEAAFASEYASFEVVVVDDGSQDGSVDVIGRFPCRLVRLDRRRGAAAARNVGAANSKGGVLFFSDADCLLAPDALTIAYRDITTYGPEAIIGGTYTPRPYDDDFFSTFQSVFVNYSETKRPGAPDYIATHAMAVDAQTFRRAQGFAEDFLPILEDVEFSHRLRRAGCRLVMNPAIAVRHVFGFSLLRSLRNAFVKSMYWTVYSLGNRDLLADSGTASVELKFNVAVWFLGLVLLGLYGVLGDKLVLLPLPPMVLANLYVSRGLLKAFRDTKGLGFAIAATLYYAFVYPLAVGAGALAGMARSLRARGRR